MKDKKFDKKGASHLKEMLEGEREKVRQYTDMLQHLQADFENYRKRVEREQDENRKYANQKIVEEFLEVKDNLDRALEDTSDHEAVIEGVKLTLRQLGGLLKKHGVEEIKPLGVRFDPNYHEALMVEEADVKQETVSEVLQTGYLLHSRVIRPAKVKIKKPREVD